jgi:DNA-binding XRE family transcriptional regulator
MNAVAPPAPIHADAETVTFSRAAWDAFLGRLEDDADLATIAALRAERERLGDAAFMRRCYTADEAERMINGISAIAIWRARLGLTQKALAEHAGISPSYLAEIETGRKPGSAAALAALARVFGVPMEMLVE